MHPTIMEWNCHIPERNHPRKSFPMKWKNPCHYYTLNATGNLYHQCSWIILGGSQDRKGDCFNKIYEDIGSTETTTTTSNMPSIVTVSSKDDRLSGKCKSMATRIEYRYMWCYVWGQLMATTQPTAISLTLLEIFRIASVLLFRKKTHEIPQDKQITIPDTHSIECKFSIVYPYSMWYNTPKFFVKRKNKTILLYTICLLMYLQ